MSTTEEVVVVVDATAVELSKTSSKTQEEEYAAPPPSATAATPTAPSITSATYTYMWMWFVRHYKSALYITPCIFVLLIIGLGVILSFTAQPNCDAWSNETVICRRVQAPTPCPDSVCWCLSVIDSGAYTCRLGSPSIRTHRLFPLLIAYSVTLLLVCALIVAFFGVAYKYQHVLEYAEFGGGRVSSDHSSDTERTLSASNSYSDYDGSDDTDSNSHAESNDPTTQ